MWFPGTGSEVADWCPLELRLFYLWCVEQAEMIEGQSIGTRIKLDFLLPIDQSLQRGLV